MDPGLIWTYGGLTVSFIIFVVILHYLLYKPVSRILKERKDDMEAELRRAEELRAEAEAMQAKAERHEQELEAKREGILSEAQAQAEQERKDLLQEAEDQARAKLDRFRRVMKQERDDLLGEITEDLRGTILHVARSVLGGDLGDLSDRAITRIGELIDGLPEEDKSAACAAAQSADSPVEVRAAAELSAKQENQLKSVIASKLGVDNVALKVSVDSTLLAGLEVTLGHLNLVAHWRGLIDEAMEQKQS